MSSQLPRDPSSPALRIDERRPHRSARARLHGGVGGSTVLVFAVTTHGTASAIFQTLARHPSLRADTVAARIETIRGSSAGSLTLLVHGDPAALRAALTTFAEQAIPVEVVGHVRARS